MSAANHYRPWLPTEIDEFARLWARGISYARIAPLIGRTAASCRNKGLELKFPSREVVRQYHSVQRLPHAIVCQSCGITETRQYLTYVSGKTMARKATFCTKCLKARTNAARQHKKNITPRVIFWTEERKQKATELWKSGHSSHDLARYFGVSRNAACGIVHRLGLMGGRRVVDNPHARKLRKRAKQQQRRAAKRAAQGLTARNPARVRARPAAMSSSIAPAPLSYTKPIVNLDAYLANDGCKWLNDDGPCGKSMWQHSKIYCEHHEAVSRRR